MNGRTRTGRQGGRHPNNARTAARTSQGGENGQPMRPRYGPVAELVTLKPGKATNCDEFIRRLTIYGERNYPYLGTIFRTYEYFNPPNIVEGEAFDIEELNEENDPHGLTKLRIQEEIKNRIKIVAQMEQDKIALFATMWGQLSPESEQLIRQHDDWENIQHHNDPLALLLAILDTHRVQAVGQAQLDRGAARELYARLRQGPQETLVRFKERTDEAIRALEAYGAQVPDDEDQAVDFINRLDKSRYGQLQVDLVNDANLHGAAFPNSLTMAYQVASRYRVLVQHQKMDGKDVVTQSVFITEADTRMKERRKKEDKNKTRQDKTNKKEDKGSNRRQNGTEKRTSGCWLCENPDHWAKDCPFRADCKQLIEDRRSSNEDRVHLIQTNEPRSTRRNNTYLNRVHSVRQENENENENEPRLDFAVVTVQSPPSLTPTNTNDLVLAVKSVELQPNDVLLDNQATAGVFRNAELLTNLRESNRIFKFSGLGGAVESTIVGDIQPFGTVAYAPEGIANILSFAEVEAKYPIDYIPNQGFLVRAAGQEYFFKRKGNLYVCEFKPFQRALLTTVEQNESIYTKREVEYARKARQLMQQLGYASSKDLIKLINSGGILNCPVTAHDVYRAHKIYGLDIPSLKGKSKLKTPLSIKVEHIPRPVVSELVMHIDIMKIEGDPYLLSVTTPLGLTIVTHLQGSRSESFVKRALLEQIKLYKTENFTIRTILTDGEGAVQKISSELMGMGIRVNPSGPGQHVPVIENKIKQVKERVRSHLAALPFTLASFLIKWLVLFCVMKLNQMPNSSRYGSPVSPFELFRGRKLDYNRDVRIGFGEYVQADNPNISFRNSMTPRTDGAIALLPTGNLQGSVKFYSLATGGIITRDHWKIIPMPTTVINYMNQLAKDSKRKASSDPIFQYGDDDAVPTEESNDQTDEVVAEDEEPQIQIEDPPTTITGSGNSDAIVFDPEPVQEQMNADQQILDQPNQSEPEVDPVAEQVLQDLENIANSNRYNLRNKRTHISSTDKVYEYGFNLTVKEALKKLGPEAKKAIMGELSQHLQKKTWIAVRPGEVNRKMRAREAGKIIRSKMFLKMKYNSSGEFEKLKARLVAGGHMQDRTVYEEEEIAAATVDITSFFIISSIAAKEKRKVRVVDIGGAYLNARIKNKIILMRIEPQLAEYLVELDPQEYQPSLQHDQSIIVQLDKALYGCIESAKLWFDHLTTTLKDYGFEANPLDPCVLNKIGTHGKQLTICIYVDDLFITSEEEDDVNDLIKFLRSKYKEITVKEGDVISYLGMTLDYSVPGEVRITQEGYTNDFLQEYEVTGTAKTPATSTLFEINNNYEELSTEEKEQFHSRVAKLLFIAKRTRPDILTAIAFLTTRVNKPTKEDWHKLQRVLKYINGTRNRGILLNAGDSGLELFAFIDAAYGVHVDGKSHSGIAIILGYGPVFFRSAKQRLVVKSSAEAELVAVSDESSRVIWCREFIIHQGYSIKAVTVYQDNQSTIATIAKGRPASARSKHINIRYFFIKDRVEKGEIKIKYLSTKKMISDILTKPLQGELFLTLRAMLTNEKVSRDIDKRAGECQGKSDFANPLDFAPGVQHKLQAGQVSRKGTKNTSNARDDEETRKK